uniref:Putative subfamily protein s1a unassigned peptidase n=1 Tax=Ixodes ricinus TaxID=34613 RepID=A0A6B0UWI6_IXORI
MVLTRVLPLILMAGVAIPGLSQSRIVQRVEERIAGGRPATYREFPFQVAILDHRMKQICGGSLISPLEVLTAAHCLDDEKVSHLSVIAGSLTSRLPYSATHQVRKNDSGGPVVQYKKGSYVLVGIIAWGVECGNPKYPGVYMEVSSFLPWIADHSTVQV